MARDPIGFYQAIPPVPKLISKAFNTEHNIAEGESWDQQLNAVCDAAAMAVDGETVDWDQVQMQIATSQSPHLAGLHYHIHFVKKYGEPYVLTKREVIVMF